MPGAAAVKAAKLTIVKALDLNLRTGAPAFVTVEFMAFPLGSMVRLRERRLFLLFLASLPINETQFHMLIKACYPPFGGLMYGTVTSSP
jgi:hypothetical protein